MKKSFKRAGVAVLSMAMLLSMGAVGAMTANAAPATSTYSVTISGASTNGYSYSKIADLDEDLVHYTMTTDWNSTDVEVDSSNHIAFKSTATPAVTSKMRFSDYTAAADKQKLALNLAAKNVTFTNVTFTNVTADTVTGLTPGYYVFKSDSAQPILVEVKNANVTGLTAKATSVTIDKTITSITAQNTNADPSSLVKDNGKVGLVDAGSIVNYSLDTQFPVYDVDALTGKNITDFTIVDIPEDTLTIKRKLNTSDTTDTGIVVKKKSSSDSDWVTLAQGTDYSVADASNSDIRATDKTTDEKYFKSTDATKDLAGNGFKITFVDATVLSNVGAQVKVEFAATVSTAPDMNNDKNRNSAVVEYHDNYFTAGYNENNPDNPDEPDKHDDSDADVYCTLFTVNKKDQDGTALPGATFTLYKGTGDTKIPIKSIGSRTTTDAEYLSVFSFEGLDIGTYTLSETQTPSDEYVKAPDIEFVITETGTNGTFHFATTDASTVFDNGVFDITNTKGQNLPGTGGMGTVLFTVGGAAIVLLAGALFVVYLRKRKTEE